MKKQDLTIQAIVKTFQTYQITQDSWLKPGATRLNQDPNRFNPNSLDDLEKQLNRFNLNDWNDLTEQLIKNFGSLKMNNIPVFNEPESSIGGFVEINDKYIGSWFDELTQISFISCYPNIIANKIKTKKFLFNYESYGDIFAFICENRSILKTYCEENNLETFTTINVYINYLYGILGKKEGMIKMNISYSKISEEMRDLMKKIYRNFEYFIPYIDSDTIFAYKFNYDLIEFIQKHTYLNFEIEKGYSGTFIKKKQYILNKNIIIKKGFIVLK
jgi:hypothetical protein